MAPALRIALLFLVSQSAVSAPAIRAGGVRNAAGELPQTLPAGGVAPGSIVVVRGARLGPTRAVESTQPVSELSGVSVRVIQGDADREAALLFASSTEVRAVLPVDLQPGEARLEVSYEGETSEPAKIRVERSAFGIFSRGATGSRAALDGTIEPGQRITIVGTGLGASSGTQNLEVFVANQPAKAKRVEPRRPRDGIDEIEVDVPDETPLGCNVPVQVRVDGVPSNVATISTEPIDSNCGRFESLVDQSGRVGFVSPLKISFLNASASHEADVLSAGFWELDSDRGLRRLGAPPEGACTAFFGEGSSHGLVDLASLGLAQRRLEGGTLQVGDAPVEPPSAHHQLYFGVLGGSLPGRQGPSAELPLSPGRIEIRSTPGIDVGAFDFPVLMPKPIRWVGREEAAVIPRTQDLEVRWRGADRKQEVAVAAASVDEVNGVWAAFLCLASAADRKLRVPAPILETLPASRELGGQSHGFVFVATFDADAAPIYAAPGLDGVLGTGASLDGRTVRFE